MSEVEVLTADELDALWATAQADRHCPGGPMKLRLIATIDDLTARAEAAEQRADAAERRLEAVENGSSVRYRGCSIERWQGAWIAYELGYSLSYRRWGRDGKVGPIPDALKHPTLAAAMDDVDKWVAECAEKEGAAHA